MTNLNVVPPKYDQLADGLMSCMHCLMSTIAHNTVAQFMLTDGW